MGILDRLKNDKIQTLSWYPELGIGYYPVKQSPYDATYFKKYENMAKTKMGEEILKFRTNFIATYAPEVYVDGLIDVGIGSGSFVEAIGCSGFDINPHGINWLMTRNLYANPYVMDFCAATFWDSLEHIRHVEKILSNIRDFVFMSIPIFRDAEHVLHSKHFRPDEHCWYFTDQGVKLFMGLCGFIPVAQSNEETKLGREDIGTYAFSRVK